MVDNEFKKTKKILKNIKKYDKHITDTEEQQFIKEQEKLTETVKKISAFTTLRQLWFLIAGARKKLPILFIFMVVGSLLGLMSISLVIPFILFLQNASFIDPSYDISSAGRIKQIVIEISRYLYDMFEFTNSGQLIIFFGIAFLGVFLLRIVFEIVIGYISHFYTAHAVKVLVTKIYMAVLYMSYSYYLGRTIAQTMFSMSLSGRTFAIIQGTLGVINDLLIMFMLGVGITFLTPGIVYVAVGIFIVAFVSYYFTNRELRRLGEIELLLSKKQSISMYHGIHNFTFSRLFGAESFFLRMFHSFYDRTVPLGAYRGIIAGIPRIVLEIFIVAAFVFYAVFIVIRFPDKTDELITTAAVLAAAVFKIMPASLRLVGYLGAFAGNQVSVNEFYEEYINAIQYKEEEADDILPIIFKETIQIKDISFGYPVFDSKGRNMSFDNAPLALRHISMNITKGSKIGVIGTSGGGKTTFLHVLMGFLKPLSGEILIDEKLNIYEDTRAWQKIIGYVPQDTLLMSDTVINNIAFGLPPEDISLKKVEKVLKISQLWSVIKKMPKGMETNIGDSGKRLSGGQRQRLGIARALYRDPQVLFFDEATSNLDMQTEEKVQKTIDELPKNKTIIMVAHRLNTLSLCDVIYRIESGKIVFSGSYKEICKYIKKGE